MGVIRNKNEKIPFMYTIIMFCVIFFSHDTMLFGTNSSSISKIIRLCVPVFLIVLIFLTQQIKQINGKSFVLISIVCILPFLSCLINNESINNYLYRFSVILVAGLIVVFFNSEYLYETFNRVLAVLTFFSLFVFVISNVARNIIYYFPSVRNIGGVVFHWLGLAVVPESSQTIIRNHSIFREPGVFVVFLVFAIIFEMVFLKNTNFKRLILFFVGILSTLSTAGYIILLILIIYMFARNKRIKNKFAWLFCFIIVFCFLFFYTDVLSTDGEMFSKLVDGSNSYGSWYARLNSLLKNIEIACENPFFGIGRYNLYDTTLAQSGNYIAVDNTNSLLINFAAFGFLYGFICLFGLIQTIKKHTCNGLDCFWVFIMVFMALSNEDIGQNIFFYYLIFDGLLNVKNTHKNFTCCV